MDEDSPKFFGDCIRELCFELGLEYSFSVLMKVIRNNIPATHISCSKLDTDIGKTTIFIELNDLDVALPKTVIGGDTYFNLLPYKINLPGDVNIYNIEDTNRDSKLWDNLKLVDSIHRSMLSMELFSEGNTIYFMGLRAMEPGVFNMRHAKLLSYLKAPIAHLARDLFLPNLGTTRTMLNAATESESAQAMLERCRGLSTVMRQVHEVASTNANVLIIGDTGVGKELVAEATHDNSMRRGRPYVKVNCGAIPENLLEAELFGYERGAFTGAVAAHKGYFEQAHGGTLYLDEVGELSQMAQVRLLRVLESHEVQRIGSPKRTLLDFRLICATNKDLAEMVKQGSFRIDLWYRINSYIINIPPLDRRKEDIAVLMVFFCQRCAVDIGMQYQPKIKPEMMHDLVVRDWPGNVRQIRHWVERALIHTRAMNSSFLLEPLEDTVVPLKEPGGQAKAQATLTCHKPAGAKGSHVMPLQTLDDAIRRHIELALRISQGRIQGRNNAADILGMNPGTLRSKMRKLGISVPDKA